MVLLPVEYILCPDRFIAGINRWGNAWVIPKRTGKPSDARHIEKKPTGETNNADFNTATVGFEKELIYQLENLYTDQTTLHGFDELSTFLHWKRLQQLIGESLGPKCIVLIDVVCAKMLRDDVFGTDTFYHGY